MIPPQHHRNSPVRQAQVFGFDEEPKACRVKRALRIVVFSIAAAGLLSAVALPFFT